MKIKQDTKMSRNSYRYTYGPDAKKGVPSIKGSLLRTARNLLKIRMARIFLKELP